MVRLAGTRYFANSVDEAERHREGDTPRATSCSW
jgi:hypothetical protein